MLAEGGMVYVESGAPLQALAAWDVLKSGKAGQVFYQLLTRAPIVAVTAAAPAQ